MGDSTAKMINEGILKASLYWFRLWNIGVPGIFPKTSVFGLET